MLRSQVIDAAKAAIDVSCFDVARDVLVNGDVKLCVLCLERGSAAFTYFRNERLSICHECLEERLSPNEVTRIGCFSGVPSGQVWVLDYKYRRHYVTPEAAAAAHRRGDHHGVDAMYADKDARLTIEVASKIWKLERNVIKWG